MRDSQRKRLYIAEDSIDPGTLFVDLDSTQDFVDNIIQGEYWDRFDHAPRVLLVRDGRGRKHACMRETYFGGEICLPKWARSPLITIHELAHALGKPDEAHHGVEFAQRYLSLVSFYISLEAKKQLANAFDQHRVNYVATRN